MTISDLNPIQFWPVVKQTFNEKVEPGIEPCRFVLTPYKKDRILLQVLDATQSYLLAFPSELIFPTGILTLIETSGGSGIWEAVFTGDNFGDFSTNLTDSCVVFKLGTFTNFLTNPSFVATLAPWTNIAGAGPDWSWDAAAAAKVTVPLGQTSDGLQQTFTKRTRGIYNFKLVSSVDQPAGVSITIEMYNDGLLVYTMAAFSENLNVPTTHEIIAAVSGDFNSIQVKVFGGAAVDAAFLAYSLEIKEFIPFFKSDQIFISDEVFGTQLLQYSNANNYAGIDYTGAEKFCLRVPAKFYEERQPEEDESEALSDSSIVKLAGTVKRQKYLEIEPLPPYMILKIKLILKHNSLKVDEDYYIQEEAMDVAKLNDRFALFISRVWLTLRNNGFFTNVYGAAITLDQTSGLPTPESDFDSGVSYFGNPEVAHAETFLGGLINEGGETLFGLPKVGDNLIKNGHFLNSNFWANLAGPNIDWVFNSPQAWLTAATYGDISNPLLQNIFIPKGVYRLNTRSLSTIASGFSLVIRGYKDGVFQAQFASYDEDSVALVDRSFICETPGDCNSIEVIAVRSSLGGAATFKLDVIDLILLEIKDNMLTYIGSPEPAHAGTFLGGAINEGGETYLGAPEVANDETYIGAVPSANAELVFADEVEGSILTYIGDDMNEHPGWGCILGRCTTNIGSSVIAWDGGGTMHWDDDDEIEFGG